MVVAGILSTIVNAIINHAIGKESEHISNKIREKLGRDPAKMAFGTALNQAFAELEKQHPQWVSSNFDASFFAREGAPILAQFLFMNGRPDPGELAERWANSLNIRNTEHRTHYISELEPIAADFLRDLAQQLKQQEALRDLNESRALDQIAQDMQIVCQHLEAEKATSGTRQDYLRWLIERNLYLDPRGTFQTQRQVQLKLNEIYISLQAQSGEARYPGDTTSPNDRRSLREEFSDFQAETDPPLLLTEQRAGKRERSQRRLENQSGANKTGEVLELAEVIARHDRVVILGDPGSGKTTLLRYLALRHASASWSGQEDAGEGLGKVRFPFLLRVAEYAENGIWKRQSLSDFFPDSCTIHDCPRRGLADLFQNELEKGECLVLLDGLDEIVSADERSGVVRQIEDFVRRHGSKGNRFVVTSRIAGYANVPLGEPFKHYTIREMNETQIQRFLERWCNAVEDSQTPELSSQERARTAQREIDGILQAIQRPGVHRLAVNPLLLRILALIHRTGAKLPQKRIELYKLAADTLARTWRTAQGVAEAELYKESALLKEDYLTPLLSELAYWLHTNKPTGIATEHEVYEVLGEAWARMNELHWDADNPHPGIQAEIRTFLSAVHTHTGLFVERAPKRYGFLHLTFEEYYVARYLVAHSRKRARLIREHLHRPRWEEPILLAIGFVGLDYPHESSELVETAILAQGEGATELGFAPSPYEDLLGCDYLFALHCLGDNIPVRRGLMEQLTRRLASEYIYRSGSARFSRYVQALNETFAQLAGSESAHSFVPHLSAELQDGQLPVRMRSDAATMLGILDSSSFEVLHVLVSALQDGQANVSVRSAAAIALGQPEIASTTVTEALLTVLQESQIEAEVRRYAAWALGRHRPGVLFGRVTEVLLAVLQDSRVEIEVRSTVAWSLRRLNVSPEAVTEALLAVLQNSQVEAEVRRYAVWGLGRYRPVASPTRVIEALLTVLRDSQVEAEIRSAAIITLGRLGAHFSLITDTLSAFLRDSSIEIRVRSNVVIVLGDQEPSSAVTEALLAILQDSQIEAAVRSNTATALGQVGDSSPAVISALLAVLQDSQIEARIRSNAAAALGRLGNTSLEVTGALLAALQDKRGNARVRGTAATALGNTGFSSPAVTRALLAVLQADHVENRVRGNAATALGNLGDSSQAVISSLLSVLRDGQGDARVRVNAALSLELLGQEKVLSTPEIASVLCSIFHKTVRRNEEWSTRRDLAQVLSQLHHINDEILAVFWQGLLDQNNEVRNACTQALAQVGKRQSALRSLVEKRLVEVIDDPAYEIRDKAENRPAYDYAYQGLWLLVADNQT